MSPFLSATLLKTLFTPLLDPLQNAYHSRALTTSRRRSPPPITAAQCLTNQLSFGGAGVGAGGTGVGSGPGGVGAGGLGSGGVGPGGVGSGGVGSGGVGFGSGMRE